MMRSFLIIVFIWGVQCLYARQTMEPEWLCVGVVGNDSIGQASEDTDTTIMIQSKYRAERMGHSNELDSISRISAPFTIHDPRFIKKGEMKYILQDRYLEEGKPFSNWLFDRMDVGLLSGYSRLAPRSEHVVKPGVPLGFYVKYNLDRLHAVRLSYARTRFEVEGFGNEIEHHGVDLDYMLNMSSFLYGHNAQRVMNVSAVLGGGYINTKFRGNAERAWKAQAGLNFDFKLSPSSHLFVEPYVAIASDQVDHSMASNAHRWDAMFGVKAGVGVNFNYKADTLKQVNYNGNLFWEFRQGLTFFGADEIDVKESMGTCYTLSVGKWLDPYVGVRLSGLVSEYNHVQEATQPVYSGSFMVVPSYEKKARTVLVGGRLELLVDVLNFFPRYRSVRHPKFAWQLSAGGEFGFMGKKVLKDQDGRESTLKTSYAGVVLGSQFLYASDGYSALFLEPRVSFANYSQPYTNAPDYKAKFTDRVFSVNVGVRVSQLPKKEQGQRLQVFEPRLFAGIVAGSLRGEKTATINADGKTPLSVGVCVGKEFAPLVAAKLQVEYQRTQTASMQRYGVAGGTMYARPALFNEDYTVVNAKLAYMFSFSNFYQGYDRNRRLSVYVELGPSYVHVLKKEYSLYSKEMPGGKNPQPAIGNEQGEGGAFGLFGGVVADIRLGKKLHVQLEPYGQMLTKSLLYGGALGKMNQDFLTGVNVGATYSF